MCPANPQNLSLKRKKTQYVLNNLLRPGISNVYFIKTSTALCTGRHGSYGGHRSHVIADSKIYRKLVFFPFTGHLENQSRRSNTPEMSSDKLEIVFTCSDVCSPTHGKRLRKL